MSAPLIIEPRAMLTHPLCLFAFQLGIFGATAFTKPDSAVRYAAITAMASITGYIHLTIDERMDNRFWKPPVEGGAVYFLLNAVERLLVSRWSYEAGGPEKYRKRIETNGSAAPKMEINGSVAPKMKINGSVAPKIETNGGVDHRIETNGGVAHRIKTNGSVAHKNSKQSTSSQSHKSRFRFFMELIFSLRGVAKPWQVKNIPRFSSTDPAYIPSRGYFLLRCLALVLPLFLFIDFCTAQSIPEAHLIAANKQPFLRRLSETSYGEVIFRMSLSIGFWLSGAAFWNMVYYTVAFVLVTLNVSKPSAWPSAFDWPTKAYSVRKFWGLETFHIRKNKSNG